MGPDFLSQAWESYKVTFIAPEGYVWDRFRDGGEVTSEGQSYALLRAAWMRDEETFRRVFRWTEETLLREDGLYSWRWTPEGGGRILDPNTASDAEIDIAFALIVAAKAFDDNSLLQRARGLVRALRKHASIMVPGGRVVAAGNWAVDERVVNISYFAPYAYSYFAILDPEGGWSEARNTGYNLVTRIIDLSPANLIADFVVVDEEGAPAVVENKENLDSDFSFDAMRTYWRVAVDCMLLASARACADPARTSAAAGLLARDGDIYSRYSLSGERLSDTVSLSFYGSLLPAFSLFEPQLAKALQRGRLAEQGLRPLLGNPDRYYDLNWIWFGLAAESGLIERNTPSLQEVESRVQAFGSE